MMNRRGLLALSLGAALAAGLPVSLAAPAAAQPRGVYAPSGGFSVDATVLLAKGGGRPAALIADALRAELPRAFARRGAPGRVVVRLTGLSLSPYAGQGVNRLGLSGGGESDYLEGEVLLLDGRGAVVAAKPLLTVLPASPVPGSAVPELEPGRLRALAANFAGWAARSI